ncbi:MAG: NAD+ synthase [Pseudomonadota bacterium]
MTTLRIAQAQINPTVGNINQNVEKILSQIKLAFLKGADLVTFPELALTGYPPEDLLLRRGFLSDNLAALEDLAHCCVEITAIVGFADWVDGSVRNAAALISRGEIVGIYHKIELPNYGVFDEKRYFTPGTNCFLFDIFGTRISVTICEDIWIPGSATELCAINNAADIVLNISGSPFFAGKYQIRKNIASRFAKSVDCVLFFNNLVGGQDELVFDGGSFVVDRTGGLISSAVRFKEDLLVTDIEISPKPKPDVMWNTGYTSIEIAPSSNRRLSEPIPKIVSEELGNIDEIFQALTLGVADYVRKNGFKYVVIGLSGGIDSALTAAIAVEALGREFVIGVTMPSEFTSTGTLSDAGLLAENLGIKLITIPIEEILTTYLKVLQGPFSSGSIGLEGENLQARIRGAILMALSNRFGWLVLTTGNKSETAVGYCTLYGDTAGGFAVIKDVPKTLVYELSEYVNKKAATSLIPDSVLKRPPTAELRPNQKDEDSLPPYSILDPILKEYVEDDKSCDEILGYPEDVVREVARMVDLNEYKRRQAPPGVKITPKAFGKDRRLPITNRYTNYTQRGNDK